MEPQFILQTQDRQFALTGGDTIIGRSRNCHLVLRDPSVSRNHSLIIVQGDTVTLKDLNSTNGTYVNGRRVDRETQLAAGDRVTIGEVEMVLQERPPEQRSGLDEPPPLGLATRRMDAQAVSLAWSALEVDAAVTEEKPVPKGIFPKSTGSRSAVSPREESDWLDVQEELDAAERAALERLAPAEPAPPKRPAPQAAPEPAPEAATPRPEESLTAEELNFQLEAQDVEAAQEPSAEPTPAVETQAAPELDVPEEYFPDLPDLGAPPRRPGEEVDYAASMDGTAVYDPGDLMAAAAREVSQTQLRQTPPRPTPAPTGAAPAATGTARSGSELLPSLDDLDGLEAPSAAPAGKATGATARPRPGVDKAPQPARKEGPPAVGFWPRAAAMLLDSLLIFVISLGLPFLLGADLTGPLPLILGFSLSVLMPVFGWSLWGTTPGKHLLGLAVFTLDGKMGLGVDKAMLRLVGYLASSIFAVGFLMVAFTANKRGLHDLIAGTYVGRRP